MEIKTTTHIHKSTPAVLWVAAVALIIFSIGVGAFMGLTSNSLAETGAEETRAKAGYAR